MKRGSPGPIAAILLLLTGCRSEKPSAALAESVTLTVSAASDLLPAFEELGPLFERKTGARVRFNFGSTGQLAQQIRQGAPVDLFAAANVSYIDALEKEGRTIPDSTALYARGRLTLWQRQGAKPAVATIADLGRADVRRVAIADPDHAPYGLAARQVMEKAGVWRAVSGKLVFGENVRQALQFAETGSVDAAVVALSLSIGSKGTWTLVPEALHAPLEQAAAVVRGTRHEREARAFIAFITGPDGRPVMKRFGFLLPGETAPAASR
jgi:molybdate transport system substrate-binding protein